MRYQVAEIIVKRCKTDPESQRLTVRNEGDGFLSFYDADQNRWLTLPASWRATAVRALADGEIRECVF